jgi:hypothetical protein
MWIGDARPGSKISGTHLFAVTTTQTGTGNEKRIEQLAGVEGEDSRGAVH